MTDPGPLGRKVMAVKLRQIADGLEAGTVMGFITSWRGGDDPGAFVIDYDKPKKLKGKK